MESKEEQLQAKLLYAMKQVCEAESSKVDSAISDQSIIFFSKITSTFIETIAKDLQSFCKHSSRSQINPSDVLLLTRRNVVMKAHLEKFSQTLQIKAKEKKSGKQPSKKKAKKKNQELDLTNLSDSN
eukprot:GCRY01000827.1.p1 GENE.GCRY01000827.1~~GCRY01000827.1.p1  ORF type:complete len:127 (-),score=6.93 GCRY01000827.1:24-404(-)